MCVYYGITVFHRIVSRYIVLYSTVVFIRVQSPYFSISPTPKPTLNVPWHLLLARCCCHSVNGISLRDRPVPAYTPTCIKRRYRTSHGHNGRHNRVPRFENISSNSSGPMMHKRCNCCTESNERRRRPAPNDTVAARRAMSPKRPVRDTRKSRCTNRGPGTTFRITFRAASSSIPRKSPGNKYNHPIRYQD